MTSTRTSTDRNAGFSVDTSRHSNAQSRSAGPSESASAAEGRSNAMASGDGRGGPGPRHADPGSSRGPSYSPPEPMGGGIETQRILTVFGSNTRSGYWEPAERLEVLALFGGVKLDFTDANLYSGLTIVNCLAMFGGIEIIVPPELEVDANGTGMFGGFDLKALKKRKRRLFSRRGGGPSPDLEYDPDDEPPVLRVRGFAMFGGVAVKVR